jgi:hypothetical protein
MKTFTLGLSIAAALVLMPVSAQAAASHAATPAATTLLPASNPACVKVTTELKNADKVYVALQYGVITNAKAYIAKNTLVNLLAYNNSIIKVLEAANKEYQFGSSNPRCVAASTIATYQSYLKKNLATIASIQTSNINGQPVGAPKSWLTYIPAGLLK